MAKKDTVKKSRKLVIVESPAKAKTINRYLGGEFLVMASMGHVRDLPSKTMGIDISDDFKPTYEIIASRKNTITQLKAATKDASMVYLATDLDREGEAIAWHLVEALKIKPQQARRVVFNAITRSAIEQAFAHSHSLNIDKVNAQQARRILDRIVGYEISPLLWKKVARGLSAGRVQSVAVKLIVDREKEILAFVPEEYWKTSGIFSTSNAPDLRQKYQNFLDDFQEKIPTAKQKADWLARHNSWETQLISVGGKTYKPHHETEAQQVHKALSGVNFKIKQVTTKRTQSTASAPFITSTLQQQAANRLGFSTKRTMQIAQQLYEGVELSDLGGIGLITYMRTDSTHLAPEAVQAVRDFISQSYGSRYLPDKARIFSTSHKSAQEAHEAIRPTDVALTPERLRNELNATQWKLYQLIWNRFVASQMNPALWDVTSVTIAGETSLGEAIFKASGRKLVFDGFMKVSGVTTSNGEQILPALEEGAVVWPVKIEPTKLFTTPPARYTEASLVKTLEAEGIGRPSTYATIISTIQARKYVEQIDKKFHATDLGIVVTDKLSEHFPKLMDLAFTSHMEEQLDKIEEQHLDWINVLHEFYGPFKENLDRAHEEMVHAKAQVQPSEYTCPKCSRPLVYRFGKNGRFLSCSGYPDCEFAAPCDRQGKLVQPQETEHKCPNCGKAMILRQGRFGAFLGCSGYPECKTTMKMDRQGNLLPPKSPPQPTGIRCYKCEGELVIRQSKRGDFLGCNRFPKCRTIISGKQLDNLQKWQQQGIWPPKSPQEADELLGRKKKSAGRKKTGDKARTDKSRPQEKEND